MPGHEGSIACEVEPGLLTSTRIAASETAISAGWAFSVNVSRSGGPSHMITR